MRPQGGSKGKVPTDAEAHSAQAGSIHSGLIRKPIENSSGIGIESSRGGVSGVVIPPQPTCGIGLDHRTDRFTAVEDLRSGHHVAIAGEAIRQARDRITELIDVGVEKHPRPAPLGLGLCDIQTHQAPVHSQADGVATDLHILGVDA